MSKSFLAVSRWPLAISNYLPLLLIPILYLITLARTLVLGDPTEYTLVANTLGIAHPPGYVFITLLGKLFQTLIPFGEIPWRMHLLSATTATIAALFVYATIRTLAKSNFPSFTFIAPLTAIFAALTLATSTDIWQHAIHTNPHIITATFIVANLFFLTKWGAGLRDWRPASGQRLVANSQQKWLFIFCFSAGLGVTHHPLTVMSFPAYALFIVVSRPGILRDWQTLAKMVAFALLGLSLWLYYPIRSSMEPVFGPHTMNTLNGFLDHILARGLTESLPFFTLADQFDRATVFWTLLRLQYSLPTIFLALFGLVWLLWGSGIGDRGSEGNSQPSASSLQPPATSHQPLFFLYILTFATNYAFVINLRAQDIMAYLLGIFMIVALLAGIGLYGLVSLIQTRLKLDKYALAFLFGALFLLGPVLQIARNLPRVSLHNYSEGQDYVNEVFDYFSGRGENAILLNDWEHMTPLWYTRFVEERWPDPADVRPEFVSTDLPWLESVFAYLGGGPVYLNGYRAEIVNAGFRLRPRGEFYQVVEPGDASIPPELTTLEPTNTDNPTPSFVAYGIPTEPITAGDYVPVTLAMSAPITPTEFFVPVITFGELTFTFTTDSHLVTPQWRATEVIVERFDFALPHNLPAGTYPITIQFKNLSQNTLVGSPISLGDLTLSAQPYPINTNGLLANFRQRVGLVNATLRHDGQRREAIWLEDGAVSARPGDTLNLTLHWRSLAYAEESYTIFVHLIDPANTPLVTLDYTPLGGSTPTHLWIPKWLPNQQMLDPYRLTIPPDLPAGTYYIEVGLYEMTGQRRLHISDPAGNLAGDRLILGAITIE